MKQYIVVYSERFDDEASMSTEELNNHLKATIIKATSYGDANNKFFEVHDYDDFKVWNIAEVTDKKD